MGKNNLVILVYRRTHTGDPNDGGIFGFNDCMKSVRDWPEYSAVIGIGGVKPDPDYKEIKEKITWIGIGKQMLCPTQIDKDRMKRENPKFEDFGGKFYTFDNFLLLDKKGPLVIEKSNILHNYMFVEGRIPRAGKIFQKNIHDALLSILELAKDAPPSPARNMNSTFRLQKSGCYSLDKGPSSGGCV